MEKYNFLNPLWLCDSVLQPCQTFEIKVRFLQNHDIFWVTFLFLMLIPKSLMNINFTTCLEAECCFLGTFLFSAIADNILRLC